MVSESFIVVRESCVTGSGFSVTVPQLDIVKMASNSDRDVLKMEEGGGRSKFQFIYIRNLDKTVPKISTDKIIKQGVACCIVLVKIYS